MMGRIGKTTWCVALAGAMLAPAGWALAEQASGGGDKAKNPKVLAGPQGKGERQGQPKGNVEPGERRGPGGPAGFGGPPGPGGPDNPLMRALGSLNLSEAQKQEIQNIVRGGGKHLTDAQRSELRKIEEQIQQLHEQRRKIIGEPNREEMIEKIRAVLTPEQREQLEQRMQQFRERRGEEMDGGPRPQGRRPEGRRGPNSPSEDKLNMD